MWIKTSNKGLWGNRFYNAKYMDEAVHFTDNGKAQVTSEVGKALIENFGAFEESGDSTLGYDEDVEDIIEDKTDTTDTVDVEVS